jgi:hypothetical protein
MFRRTASLFSAAEMDGESMTAAPKLPVKARRDIANRFLVCMVLPHIHVERFVFYRTSRILGTLPAPLFCKEMYQSGLQQNRSVFAPLSRQSAV